MDLAISQINDSDVENFTNATVQGFGGYVLSGTHIRRRMNVPICTVGHIVRSVHNTNTNFHP